MSINVHECPFRRNGANWDLVVNYGFPKTYRYASRAWLAPGKTLSRKPEGETGIILFPGLFPGLFPAATVLSVNPVGDGLRDLLDPRFAKEV